MHETSYEYISQEVCNIADNIETELKRTGISFGKQRHPERSK